MKIPDRIIWALFRRRKLMRLIPGFRAHWNTYADQSCVFSEHNELYKGSFLSHVNLGRFTYITEARVRYALIGNFCSIAPEAMVGGLGKHPVNFLSTHPALYSLKRPPSSTTFSSTEFEELPTTTVGSDVWVGTRAIIMDGIKVGNGAIIAANAVVTKDVDAYTIVAGVPARPVRKRFEDDVISVLEAWKWWNLPFETIRKLSPFFNKITWTVSDIDKMILLSQQENS